MIIDCYASAWSGPLSAWAAATVVSAAANQATRDAALFATTTCLTSVRPVPELCLLAIDVHGLGSVGDKTQVLLCGHKTKVHILYPHRLMMTCSIQ